MEGSNNTPLEKGNQFYVYAYTDPRNGEVFYIGKGSGDRYKQVHVRQRNLFFSRKFNKIIESGMEPEVEVVYSTDDEEAAYELEEFLISEIGRWAEGGTLTNLSAGGEGNTNYYFDKSFYDRLGKDRDQELADEYGCCRELVCYHRNSLGIPHLPRTYETPPPVMGGWNRVEVSDQCYEDIAGGMGRKEVLDKHKISRSVYRRLSLQLGKSKTISRDTTIRKFRNTKTGEIFTGTRGELANRMRVSSGEFSGIIQGKKRTCRGWEIYKGEGDE